MSIAETPRILKFWVLSDAETFVTAVKWQCFEEELLCWVQKLWEHLMLTVLLLCHSRLSWSVLYMHFTKRVIFLTAQFSPSKTWFKMQVCSFFFFFSSLYHSHGVKSDDWNVRNLHSFAISLLIYAAYCRMKQLRNVEMKLESVTFSYLVACQTGSLTFILSSHNRTTINFIGNKVGWVEVI